MAKVTLVGAGPGDPLLLTSGGEEALRRAEVVIADRLVDPSLYRGVDGEVIVRSCHDPLAQAEITRLLVERARTGKRVVRLKGGDPFVFGRGGEEAEALAAAGIAFEVVPGVTAGVAVAAYAGIPLTHRGLAGSVVFITGHEADDKDAGHVDWRALGAATQTTLVFFMSVRRLDRICARLVEAGRSPSTPVAVIERGTTPRQRTVVGTLATIVEAARAAKLEPPALTVVGEVVRLRERLDWFEGRPLHGLRMLSLLENSDRDPAEPTDPRSEFSRWGIELVEERPLAIRLDVAALAPSLGRLDRYRWLVFTSRHGVRAFREALGAAGLDARALSGLLVACPAGATAGEAARGGFLLPDLTVEGGGRALAQAILARPERGPVLFPRAGEGRDELPDALRAAGVEVDVVPAYSAEPNVAAMKRVAADHAARPFAAIAFGSPRGAAAFLAEGPGLDGVIIGAIGETTAAALRARGLAVDVVPPRPSRAVLEEALAAALAARRKIG